VFSLFSSYNETLVGKNLLEGEIHARGTAKRMQLKNDFTRFTEYETYIFDALIEILEGKTTSYNYP
jgi:hypothetical protein